MNEIDTLLLRRLRDDALMGMKLRFIEKVGFGYYHRMAPYGVIGMNLVDARWCVEGTCKS